MADRSSRYRTILANERTVLAYTRTALTFFVAGVGFVRFFQHPLIEIVGWCFIPAGVAVFLYGLARFRKVSRDIAREPD